MKRIKKNKKICSLNWLKQMGEKWAPWQKKKDCLGGLMNFITPIPSAVNEKF